MEMPKKLPPKGMLNSGNPNLTINSNTIAIAMSALTLVITLIMIILLLNEKNFYASIEMCR
jgi:hypothetical protein